MQLTRADLAVKRPGRGIPPRYLEQLLGRRLRADMEADAVLTWDDLQ